jgi:hypothetical protein
MEDSTKSDETSADDFNLVEKLLIELQKKDEELAKEKQEKQVCTVFCLSQVWTGIYQYVSLLNQKLSADLELEKVRANRADKLETELASAQEMIEDLQEELW